MTQKVYHTYLSLTLFANVLLVGVLLVKLRVSPADLKQSIEKETTALRLEQSVIAQRQEAIEDGLRAQRLWAQMFTDAMQANSGNIWHMSNERATWEQFGRQNPGTKLPSEPFDTQQPDLNLPEPPKDK